MSHLYRVWHWWIGLSGKGRATIILEIIGILVVAAYTTVAALQWCQMKAATKATQIAAQAAKESADAEVAASRAWIVPCRNKIFWPDTPGPLAELDWKNGGKTPAVHIRVSEEYGVDFKRTFKQGCVINDNQQVSPMLMPDEPLSTGVTGRIPQDWNNGKGTVLSIHGCIRYVDVLSNQERSTEYCFNVSKQLIKMRIKISQLNPILPCTPNQFGIYGPNPYRAWE